jgi:hypothetical protein
MQDQIPEHDWKVFRELQLVALDRFCQRVLADVAKMCGDQPKSNHERYLDLFKLIQDRNDELADAFDDIRRSTAVRQLVHIQSHGLLTEEEMSRFSSETREQVQQWLRLAAR